MSSISAVQKGKQTAEPPAISVVVPAYNRSDTVGATLDSLQAQTYRGWEAIVVDDGSVDDTAEVVEDRALQDPRIKLYRQSNAGVSAARNAGIGLAGAPWLFFLDADDWIVPVALERLLTPTRGSQLDGVCGGYVRVAASGRELRERLPNSRTDLFPLFARTCAIAIHACLVRTELVRRVDGFDTSLVTCEDWDLWQRITRVGARFETISDYISYYRMRLGSASGSAWRMLHDGLQVIDRGHSDDPRLRDLSPTERPGLSEASRALARTYFACYTAGLEIASGRSAVGMLDELGDAISSDVDPHGVADTLFNAIPVGRAADVDEWSEFPPAVHRGCRAFVDALGERLDNHWLAFRAHEVFEGLLLRRTSTRRPHIAGRWYVANVELEGPSVDDVEPGHGVERGLFSLRLAGRPIEDVEVAVIDGWLPARVLADALVADTAWEILRVFLERHVHPELEIERLGGLLRVHRAGHLIFEGEASPTLDPLEDLNDQVGWTLFLQELWDRPSFSGTDFYDDGSRWRRDAGPVRVVKGDRVTLDIAEPLPGLRARHGGTVTVDVRVAGVPLNTVVCEAGKGWISTHQLRKAILIGAGYELLRSVLREGLLLAGELVQGTLHERLAQVLTERRVAGCDRNGRTIWDPGKAAGAKGSLAVVGRAGGADGTSASRWMVFPAGAADRRLALAGRDGDPIERTSSDESVGHLLCAPITGRGRTTNTRATSDESLLRSLSFEQLFAAGDPWKYGSDYEQGKYRQTLSLLPDRVGKALELGCAEGMFTAMLAPRAFHLTAADISVIALARTRERCEGVDNVAFVQLDAFDQPLGGPYDTIVCSELLYYAESHAALEEALTRITDSLTLGGTLVMAHANVLADEPRAAGFDWDVPFGASTIERACRRTGLLDLDVDLRTPQYRVQRYIRRDRRRRISVRRRALRLAGSTGVMDPASATRFQPCGGAPRRDPEQEDPAPTSMPILMYHRVAPEGKPAGRRWRVHPEDFEAQLRWLRENDYVSLTFEQWRVISDRRSRLPARSVMLTFDDGFADFPQYALPLLDRYGFQGTMFVVTDHVGASNVWDEQLGERIPLMSWTAIADIRARGIQVGSHSSRHDPLVSLSASALGEDLCRSRLALYQRLGDGTSAICYPYGLYDVGVLAVARASGFRYGVTTEEWQASLGDDLLRLPRLEVRGNDTLAEFAAKLGR